jgi:predicted metal-dependent phosphoesterase TrpH
MVAAGHADSVAAAFRRYLGRGCPGYVGYAYPALDRTLAAVSAAGGIAVLAHPLRYTLSAGARRQLLEEFRGAGGRGIEVVCGGARNQVDALAALALRFDLDGSAGSDFHDPAVPWNPPGRLAKLPHSVRPVWRAFPQGTGAPRPAR